MTTDDPPQFPPLAASGEVDNLIDAAIAAQGQGKLREAAVLFERALKSGPDNADALCRYAMLAMEAGRPDVALPVAERAVAVHGDSAFARNLLGVVLRRNGRLAEA